MKNTVPTGRSQDGFWRNQNGIFQGGNGMVAQSFATCHREAAGSKLELASACGLC